MEALKLHDAVVFLAAAGLIVPLAKRLRVNPVLGFLLIGLAVGPHGLARYTDEIPWLSYLLISDVEGVHALAELGVIFLLFYIGLELSLERLWSLRRLVFGMGNAQILLSASVIGAIAWGFGNSFEVSILLGACLALSSTAIVTQLLLQQGRFGTEVGRGSFAILLAQDIAVVPILFLAGALGVQSEGSLLLTLGLALLQAAAAVVAILLLGRLVIRPVFRFVGTSDSPELFMAVTLLTIIATAAATHAAGLSAALGAFLAGLILAETEFRHEINVDIAPFKGLLLGLFFMSVSMGINLADIAATPYWIALSVVGLFLIKSVIAAIVARLFGFGWAPAAEIGLTLGQGGEFAFVVIGLATGVGVMTGGVADFMAIVVGVTMFLTPLTTRLATRLGSWITAQAPSQPDQPIDLPDEISGHVVIVGYGRSGALMADLLDEQQIPHVALDLNAKRVTHCHACGIAIFHGDASRPAILRQMHLETAAALAICTDDPGATERILGAALSVRSDLPIIARARDLDHARELYERGATQAVPELLEAGLQLSQVLLEEIGLPSVAARDLVEQKRMESLHHVFGRADAGKSTDRS